MMLSEQLLETIRRIVTPLGAEERLAVIQAIATMPATEAIEQIGDLQARERYETSLEAEQVAWFARPAEDRARYAGEYVAVRDGTVIDHDPDRRALFLRTRQHFGQHPVLIVAADQAAPREFVRYAHHRQDESAKIRTLGS